MILEEIDKKVYLYAPNLIHQWSPLPIFTNDSSIELPDRKVGQNPFWFCRLTTFEDFLDRRSILSKKPNKHFPTRQTFKKKDEKLHGCLSITIFNDFIFKEIYDKLRRQSHSNGNEFINGIRQPYSKIPPQWFKMMTLTVDGNVIGIGSMIDDGISQSLWGLASVINKDRIGLYMLTLWIKYCCLNGKKSIDSSISGTYGIYKDQLFLDSKIVSKEMILKHE
jgi:hypothetical protein